VKKLNLPKKNQAIWLVAGGIAGAFVLRKIYRVVTNKGQAGSLGTGGVPAPTRSQQYYQVAADTIQKAAFDLGTDEDAIFRVFEDLNGDGDFIALFNAYGIRGYFSFSTLWVDLNLTQTLQEELSTGEIADLNQVLASRNITFRI
jgi:hypothetical protein